MERKIIKQGVGGSTIFLPITWVRKNKLHPGDSVQVIENNNRIVISPSMYQPGSLKTKEITIVDKNQKQIRSIIASLYKQGYDEIVLYCKVPVHITEINSIVSTFTGLEVMHAAHNKIMLKSLLQEREEDIEKIIIRMIHTLKLILEIIDDQWTKVNLREIDTLVHTNLRKHRDLCLRTITKTKFGEDKMYDYYDFVTQLEKFGTLAYYLATYIVSKKAKKTALYATIVSGFKKLSECYFQRNFEEINAFSIQMRQDSTSPLQIKSLEKLLKKEDPLFLIYYHNLMFTMQHIISREASILS